MISKFPGKCKHCGTPFETGDEIDYVHGEGAYLPGHRNDMKPTADQLRAQHELADRLGFE